MATEKGSEMEVDEALDAASQEKLVPMEEGDQEAEDSERGRPSTPKWWRPPVPPETYKWEEVRRQRQKGGYPWTHLDKDEEIDADDYLDENLYEPVNPPPLYGNESYLSKDLQHGPQPEERRIEIPPEMEILTSEGLDGLDKPDPHDMGFDGDREWQNLASDDEQGSHAKSSFTAGIRSRGEPRPRSTTPKSVGFSPETITHETPGDEGEEEGAGEMQMEEVERPSSSQGAHGGGHGKRQTAFDILKSKAVGCADQVKARIKLAIPVRPKLNQWQGVKKTRKRRKVRQEEEGEQEVPEEDAEMKAAGVGEEPTEDQVVPEKSQGGESQAAEEEAGGADDADEKLSRQEQEEEKKRKKEEEKLKQQQEKEERERKKAEEKAAKQLAAEEAKKAKLEEKLAKAREAEEKRQAKLEEEKKKQQEKEEAARKAAEAKKLEDERKAAEKAAKEEEARIAAEAKKAEEEAKKAEKAKKAEEARLAAEAKKAEEMAKKEEEEAKKAAERAQKEEEARQLAKARKLEGVTEESTVETSAPKEEAAEEPSAEMDTAEGGEGQEEGGEEGMETSQPQTPSGTTKRRYIRHRRQLPQIPNPITTLRNQVEDFKNKLKRSRTPPRRQGQRKQRRSRSADASRSPPRDPEEEAEKEEAAQEEATSEAAEEIKADEEKPVVEESKVVQEAPKKVEKKEVSKKEEAEKVTESVQQAAAVVEDPPPATDEPPATSTGTTSRRRQPAAKEKLDKLGQQMKGFGAKSIGIASQASKEVGQMMKVVGKDLQKLGSKAMEEIKSKQEASKSKGKPATQEDVETVNEPMPMAADEITPPKRSFRFKRRNESQDEEDMEREEHYYENAGEDQADQENRLQGSGVRDWESPFDRARGRDLSEEPISGNGSSRGSPPGSSLASSHVRRTGVLEEIDSDEFFLRERGISEGEDEEEVNRMLVEELRQAFRPTMANALAEFDMEPPRVTPPRPDRAPRKPPRKDRDMSAQVTSYQTFPPERPKRKQPQGYVSKFMQEHPDDDLGSNEEVRGSSSDMQEDFESEDAIQQVKDKLSEIDRDLDEGAAGGQSEDMPVQQYEDDGRYEPVNEGPVKPMRSKKKLGGRAPTPPTFYYNTIAGNEWRREMEAQAAQDEPVAPVRKRRESGKSSSVPPEFDEQTEEQAMEGVVSAQLVLPISINDAQQLIVAEESSTAPPSTIDEGSDYVDEAGYAIVQKDKELPRTIPRKKKRTKPESIFGQQQEAQFMSFPRSAPRTIHIVPPSRPQRNYSTLKPRRPPRSKSGSSKSIDSKSPVSLRREGEQPRPSTAIGIMQGRPLPPPPRPTRSPAPLNDLDQTSIERSVGLRHYANFEDIEQHSLEEVLRTSPYRVTEVDIACQTDPVPDDEFILGITESPFEDSSRIRTASLRLDGQEAQLDGGGSGRTPVHAATTGDVSTSFQTPPSQTQPSNIETTDSNPPPPTTFPTRLRLEELEVDFLRCTDLVAQSIKVQNLQADQIEVHSLTATGPVSFARIQTRSLSSDEVNCTKLSRDNVGMTSDPTSSFYQLSSPDKSKLGSEQELCLKTEEKEEQENESACPQEYLDTVNNLLDNVDSTNDLKSSHVAEKILNNQLNVTDATTTSDSSKPSRKDASVGTSTIVTRNVPATQPPQLNNLSPEPAQTEEEKAEVSESTAVTVVQEFPVVSAPEAPEPPPVAPTRQRTQTAHVEAEDATEQKVEDTVVRGSYTLPYSYMSSQSPSQSSPPIRTPSTKRTQRSTESSSQSPKKASTPPRGDSHVAFGHTSVAQGDILSIKLSIPVERGSSGISTPTERTSPRHQEQGESTSAQLPNSAPSQAESAKKDAQTKPPVETKQPGPSGSSEGSTPQLPPATTPTEDEESSEGGDSLLDISVRIGRALLRFTMRALQSMADYLDTASMEDPTKAEQQRSNMQVILCLLLVLVVGLILATARSGPYIAPKWEFLMPPPDL